MSPAASLLSEYDRLRKATNPQTRGYQLQSLVGSLLGRSHFKVERKSRAARPRQVDVFATRGTTVYLVETKWRKNKADVSDIDSLYVRLDAVPPHVTGLFVSHSGFTSSAIERVRERSARPVVLVTGRELEAALQWDGEFVGMLHQKANSLLVHREVLVDVDMRPSLRVRRSARIAADLPSSDRTFALPDGTRSRWLVCRGGFGLFAFVPELEDIDWVPGSGFGVTLDIPLPIREQASLFDLISQLASMGWVTQKGCWSIQQATANWHGFGADALVEVLQSWKQRYEGMETHHTEELCYADICEDGFYTLVAQASADRRRLVWRAELSFQLKGIPLDPGPYRELGAHFGLTDSVYFRPRSENSCIRRWPTRPSPAVKPLASVVLLDNVLPGDDGEWVAGTVVRNPFFNEDTRARRQPEWVPDNVSDSEYLICALRSWHPIDHPKSTYDFWDFEWASTSDACLVRPVVDWRDEPDGRPGMTVHLDYEAA